MLDAFILSRGTCMRFLILTTTLAMSACVTTENTPNIPNAIPSNNTNIANYKPSEPKPEKAQKTVAKQQNPLLPKDLINQNKDKLITLLGTPSFKRRDPPAEIWRYRNRRCLVDFYFYQSADPRSVAMKIKFIESRTPKGPNTPIMACINNIQTNLSHND